MEKKKQLTYAMEALLDHYAEEEKNKIMIIDATTGQGKTTAAIELMEMYARGELLLPHGIRRMKFFYFSPQKNNWPVHLLVNSDALRMRSAFLFSQNDTFDYLVQQYGEEGSEQTRGERLLKKILAPTLLHKTTSDHKTRERIAHYEKAAEQFIKALFRSKSRAGLSPAYQTLTQAIKDFIRATYGKNKSRLIQEITKDRTSPWRFLHELYSASLIYGDEYDYFIASVDKMLYPFETILDGGVNFAGLREIFGEDTLMVLFIDEWDQAFERFSEHHHQIHTHTRENPFELTRKLLLAPIEYLPAAHENLVQDLLTMRRLFLEIHPYALYLTEAEEPIRAILRGEQRIYEDDKEPRLLYDRVRQINVLTKGKQGAPLSKVLADYMRFNKNYLHRIKEATSQKSDGRSWRDITKILLLEETPSLQAIIENTHIPDEEDVIILFHGDKMRLAATLILTPTESMLGDILTNRPGQSPTLTIGMSATANYQTPIRNFDMENIKRSHPDAYFEIPDRIKEAIREEYKRSHNYHIPGQEVKEIVIPMGRTLREARTKNEALDILFHDAAAIGESLRRMFSDQNSVKIIIDEYDKAIQRTPLHTLKDIFVVNQVLVDAREKQMKNMFVFSTNSYRRRHERVVLLYTHAFLLMQKGWIKSQEDAIRALSQEVLFASAEAFTEEKTEQLKEAIESWEYCYLVTSYMSAARGVNVFYSLKEEDEKKGGIRKIDPLAKDPKKGDKMDFQGVYLQKPAFITPQIPSQAGFGEKEMIAVIGTLFRLYESGSITEKDLTAWCRMEMGLVSPTEIDATYPANSLHGKIAAMKLAMQAIGRRTRTAYRHEKCYTYIDDAFLRMYPWEMTPAYSTLSESEQLKAIIDRKTPGQ